MVVEACVTTIAEGVMAEQAGANRLEYCIDLATGGCSPDAAMVAQLVAAVSIPVVVMVRPRSGDFVYTPTEVHHMLAEIDQFRRAGAHGIATGALRTDDGVDWETMQRLVKAAAALPVTFHRAIDHVWEAYPKARALTIHRLADLGVRRLLTGGGTATAAYGADVLHQLNRRAPASLTIIAAGSARANHVADLVQQTGVREVHARAEAIPALVQALHTTQDHIQSGESIDDSYSA